ncbi:MAG: GBS Bsp-like repeat-containing protein [Lachnospiraceae bacterium]|nr:GBS Bsp-like repeat-containing protein [Lachnospiraceae bacterium]
MKRKKAENTTNEKPSVGKVVWKVVNCILTVLVVLLGTLAMLAYRSYHWAMNTWSELSMEEIAYHLNTTIEGADDMIGQYIKSCVIITVVVLLLLIVAFVLLRKKPLFFHPLQLIVAIISVVTIVNTYNSFNKEVGVEEYMEAQNTYSSFIDDNYVDPNDVTLTFPEQKRNLVYIFLESMENTYSDQANGGAFEVNCIPELTQLSLENENFSGTEGGLNGGIPLKGATWTIGAMFAQTSGLPLNLPIDKNAMSTQEEFFPGVTSLGDILKKNGYKQTLLIGSDAAFGGRDMYFKGHGEYEIKDYYSAIEEGKIPEDYYVWWGYEDKRLFENAKEELNKLSSGNEPFNFTMLTVDTHFEDGYVCEDCPSEYDPSYSNVMACSSSKVQELINWIKEQPWYENTTIVLSGDHLTMDNDFCDGVAEDYRRSVFYTVINAPVERETQDRRTICTFDNFPTTLAALGVEIEGNRLGLGTNLYSAEPTLLERNTIEETNTGLQQQSQLMDSMLSGIRVELATGTISEYNPVTKCIEYTVSDILYKKELANVYACVFPADDQHNQRWYAMNDNGDGTYSYSIPMTDYGRNGLFFIQAYAETDDPSLTKPKMCEGNVKVKDDTFVDVVEKPEITEPSGTVIVEAYQPENEAANIYIVDAEAPNGVMGVRCAVWSADDQSDLCWYPATEVDDGIYLAKIRSADFRDPEKRLQIHVYILDNQGESLMIGATYGSMAPETEETAAPENTAAETAAPEAAAPEAAAAPAEVPTAETAPAAN